MSEAIISLRDLSKAYHIYSHPFYQALEFINPQLVPAQKIRENFALKGINFEIKKGEKIGIIGRNGSGKSTLLKIIAGRMKPTSGVCEVRGKVSGLLELGTGFYPDFTGRENVFSALAYMGIVGTEAKEKFDEIVDFAELEAYIDQPVKTYSTGMYMRLAFSVATCTEPELLLVDEVLSVGDTYFSHKSLEKMQELSADKKTTILFVSHDIYTVSRLCDALVWLDEGQVRQIGNAVEILNAYELSVKEEEEKRLAIKNRSGQAEKFLKDKEIGTGTMRIKEVWFETAEGARRNQFSRGDKMAIGIAYEVKDLSKCQNPILKFSISRDDGVLVTSSIVKFQPLKETGMLKIIFPKLLLNRSKYFVTVLAYEQLDLEGRKNRFYTIDQHLADAHIRKYEFSVQGSLAIESTVFAHPFAVEGDTADALELINAV